MTDVPSDPRPRRSRAPLILVVVLIVAFITLHALPPGDPGKLATNRCWVGS